MQWHDRDESWKGPISDRQVFIFHLRAGCAKAITCSLAERQWSILKCPGCITGDGWTLSAGVPLLGIRENLCEYTCQCCSCKERNHPTCSEQGSVEDDDLYFLGTRWSTLQSSGSFFYLNNGNEWTFAAFQDFMLMFHFCETFFRKENYLNYHEVTNPQSCNCCWHNSSYLPNMNNLVHLFRLFTVNSNNSFL